MQQKEHDNTCLWTSMLLVILFSFQFQKVASSSLSHFVTSTIADSALSATCHLLYGWHHESVSWRHVLLCPHVLFPMSLPNQPDILSQKRRSLRTIPCDVQKKKCFLQSAYGKNVLQAPSKFLYRMYVQGLRACSPQFSCALSRVIRVIREEMPHDRTLCFKRKACLKHLNHIECERVESAHIFFSVCKILYKRFWLPRKTSSPV